MTERIDLDEFETDDAPDEDARPRGSWFWSGEGDPADEVDPWSTDPADARADHDGTGVDSPTSERAGTDDADPAETSQERQPAPRVPRTNDDRPVGIPMEQGGSGGISADERPDAGDGVASAPAGEGGGAGAADADAPPSTDADAPPSTDTDAPPSADTDAPPSADADAAGDAEPHPSDVEASGPHGGGTDEMTLAFTYNAITRLSHLHGALADAEGWTDWIGVVGDVEAYVINKFQRDNHLDLDFFNGSGTGPGERLAEIDEHSMFYAERMVVVGVAGEDEHVADRAGWEFVPLADAAAKAGWELDGDVAE